MKKVYQYGMLLFTFGYMSCDTKNESDKASNEIVRMPAKDSSMTVSAKDAYKQLVFSSNDDVVCGMPVTAGVSDTAHLDGKLYGFCSPECKAEFVKDPGAYLVKK